LNTAPLKLLRKHLNVSLIAVVVKVFGHKGR
jgi:hypothetical protein